jgi:hypothetical protein
MPQKLERILSDRRWVAVSDEAPRSPDASADASAMSSALSTTARRLNNLMEGRRRLEVLVTDFAAAGLAIELVVVRRWGDRHTQLGQLCADRLDTPPQTFSRRVHPNGQWTPESPATPAGD